MTEPIHRYRAYQGRRAWLILLAAFYSVVLLQARSPGTKSCDLLFHDTLREASLVSIPAQARILPADFAQLSALNVATAKEWVAAPCPALDQLTRGGPEAKGSASPNHFIDGLETALRSALIVEGMSQLIGKAGPALKTVFKRKPKNFPNPGDAALEFVDALRGARPNDVVSRVKAWEIFLPDAAIRQNVQRLTQLSDYLTLKPGRLTEVTTHFRAAVQRTRTTAYLRGLLDRKYFDGVVYRGDRSSVTPSQAFNNGIPSRGTHDKFD